MDAGRWAEKPIAHREGACPVCPWRRLRESPYGQWRFRSGSGLSELPPPLPPPPPPPPLGEGRPPPACAQRLTQPQSRQSANTVAPAPSLPGPSPSPPSARSAFLSPTPTTRVRAIPGQETPWRRVGPNSSLAASRECRAPQPGPGPRPRVGQVTAYSKSLVSWAGDVAQCSIPGLQSYWQIIWGASNSVVVIKQDSSCP